MSTPVAAGLAVTIRTLTAGGALLVRDLAFGVAPGVALTVMGPSGIGKSSLLNVIAGTLPPDVEADASVTLDHQDLTHLPIERRRVGLLFQDALLFPHMTVAQNLAFAVPAGVPRAERRRRVEAALAEVDLSGFGGRDPATLSGGQQARVALMRTLLAQPRVLLLDEPFGRLDLDRRRAFRQMVFAHAAAGRLPTVLVTHDPDDAAAAGGPVIHLQA